MGSIVVKDGQVSLRGCAPYELPKRITTDVVYALLTPAPGQDGFIGDLAAGSVITRSKFL